MDETKHYKQDEICRKIKNELRKVIVQGNISERRIERCLPSKYKRKYVRNEVSSVSRDEKLLIVNTQRGKTLEEVQPISNHHKGSASSENGSRAIKDDSQDIIREFNEAIDELFRRESIPNPSTKDMQPALGTVPSFISTIYSVSMPLEEKIVMEDHMKKLSHLFDCMLELISSGKKEDQKKLFLAYRNSLERNIDAVNNRIAVSQGYFPQRPTTNLSSLESFKHGDEPNLYSENAFYYIHISLFVF
jgi:hypothetical protein